MFKPISALLLSAQLHRLNLGLNRIKLTDIIESSDDSIRYSGFRLNKLPTIVGPVLGLGDTAGFFCITFTGRITIADERAVKILLKCVINMLARETRRISKDNLIVLSVHRAIAGCLHFTLACWT
ncbi:MAG: hypothetical protein ACJAW7_002036 [Candidatus Azotimanducaceae bacterium]|jgi:hypothetical protein